MPRDTHPPFHTDLPEVHQETRAEMVSRIARGPRVSSDSGDPVPDGIFPTAGYGSQEAQGTDEEEKPAVQDTTSNESVELEGRKGSTFLYRVGKFLTWTPRNCRHDPDNPPKFNLALNLLFALVSLLPSSCELLTN